MKLFQIRRESALIALSCLFAITDPSVAFAQDVGVPSNTGTVPRCQIVPQSDHQVALRVDGIEQLRWNFGDNHKSPFFFPLNGPLLTARSSRRYRQQAGGVNSLGFLGSSRLAVQEVSATAH